MAAEDSNRVVVADPSAKAKETSASKRAIKTEYTETSHLVVIASSFLSIHIHFATMEPYISIIQ